MIVLSILKWVGIVLAALVVLAFVVMLSAMVSAVIVMNIKGEGNTPTEMSDGDDKLYNNKGYEH